MLNIPDWLSRPFIWLVLLYRRLRFGYSFRRIPLTQGKYAIVDPDDYPRLSRYKWYAGRNKNTFYAIRNYWSKIDKKKIKIKMHRVIINAPLGFVVDHINHNGLDNRKANLRLATYAQNARNSLYSKPNASSRYRGVYYNKKTQKWRSSIFINNKRKHIGYFRDETQAAKAYDDAAKKLHGDFASLNFESSQVVGRNPK